MRGIEKEGKIQESDKVWLRISTCTPLCLFRDLHRRKRITASLIWKRASILADRNRDCTNVLGGEKKPWVEKEK